MKFSLQTQIDQSNIVSASQTANQLATAVVNLAVAKRVTATDIDDNFPLTDLLSVEPFAAPLKNLKDKPVKVTAADSALATLKGIKALTEICADETSCQEKIVNFGVLRLLKRFLLEDDYEQLAAIEAYDASRALEAQDRSSSSPGDSSALDAYGPSKLQVPATAHLRRHAARLLTVLSVLPQVQKIIVADKSWCNWLDDCANGRIPGCNDLKTQSYAKAALLNAFCSDPARWNSEKDGGPDGSFVGENKQCAHYADNIFLINPELSHWKCVQNYMPKSDDKSPGVDVSTQSEDNLSTRDVDDSSASTSGSESVSEMDIPPLDVIFVHGLRGGPFKTWRLSEDKSSSKSGLVEKIDEEAGKQGTFWPGEWLATDFPYARLFSIKYKVA